MQRELIHFLRLYLNSKYPFPVFKRLFLTEIAVERSE